MLVVAMLAVLSCVPEGMTMPGSNEPVVRVSGADVLDGLSEQDAEQRYRRFFRLMDKNSDGYIAGQETPFGVSGFGSNPFSPAQSGPNEWMRIVDRDGDNRVDWAEFSGYALPLAAIGRCQKAATD